MQREQFTLAVESWYAQLSELVRGGHRADEPATLALSARAALLPALAERLAALPGLEVVALPDTATATGAAARAPELGPAEPPALVTALSRTHAAPGGERAARPALRRRTRSSMAARTRLASEPLVIGAGGGSGRRVSSPVRARDIALALHAPAREGGRALVRDHSRYGTFVNGERVEGEAELGPGDRLRVGTPGVVLELVTVA